MEILDINQLTGQKPKLLNQIESPNDLFTIYEVSPLLQAAHRTQKFIKTCKMTDVFSNHWMLWVGNPPKNSVYLKNKGHWIELTGPCAVYIPPYSLLQWKVAAGEYEWIGFSWESESNFPEEMAFTFSWNLKNKITTLSDLKKIIKSIPKKIDIYHEDFSSAVSSKTKNYIDKNFRTSFKLTEMSEHLKVPHSTLTHYFKKSFGLSPVEYRKRLRAADSLRLMIGNKQKTHQAFAHTGFEDYSRFYRNIKATYGSSPNKYSPK